MEAQGHTIAQRTCDILLGGQKLCQLSYTPRAQNTPVWRLLVNAPRRGSTTAGATGGRACLAPNIVLARTYGRSEVIASHASARLITRLVSLALR